MSTTHEHCESGAGSARRPIRPSSLLRPRFHRPHGPVLNGSNPDPADAEILHRAAEHPTDRYTGVFFPELVDRCVARCRTALTRSARISTCLTPVAVHAAGNRLVALTRGGGSGSVSTPVRQVLFVDQHDTGPAQMAAGLLDHYAGVAVVARSAGVDPGGVVHPFAVEILAQHGTEPVGLAPKPVTDELVRAADWIVTLGAPRLGSRLLDAAPAHTVRQEWAVDGSLSEARGPSLVADLDSRVQALWAEVTASSTALPR